MKITVSLIITCVVVSLLCHKLCEMEGFQPLTPVKEIPRFLLSTKNRAWRWCMVCNAVLKTNYRSFSYGLQNAEELVQRLSRALDTDIRFSNCKHVNKSTYHFLMQWLSLTKNPRKFCLYTSVANKALPLLYTQTLGTNVASLLWLYHSLLKLLD